MKHNGPPKEVNEMAMSKDELIGFLESVIIIAEMAEDKKEVIEALRRIQDKMKEPNAQALTSNKR